MTSRWRSVRTSGLAVAAPTAGISGVSVLVNSNGVHDFTSPAVYTTGKNLVATVLLVAVVALVPSMRARPSPAGAGRGADAHAGGQRGSVVGGHCPGKEHQVRHPGIGHPVVGEPALAACLHVPAVRQAGQVAGDPPLGQAGHLHALGDRVLGVQEELQEPQPRGVSQGTEEPGHHLHAGRVAGQQPGRRGGCPGH